jgi:hypothetical protein
MEKQLVAWIREKECGERLTFAFIRENAKNLFEIFKTKRPRM